MTQQERADRRIPVLAWALVAAAAVQLAIWAATNWYRVFGPYLIVRLEDLSSIVTGVAPFLLGAAVLVGAARWPAGRSWLHAGAGFAALHGVMQTATDAWWAWRMTDPVPLDGGLQVGLVVANLVAVTAAALAPLCLAAGLGRVESVRRASPLAAGLVVVLGLAVLAAGVGLGAREIAWSADHPSGEGVVIALGVSYRLLVTLEAVALAVLALAALRALPSARILPEVLITVGSVLAAAGLGASWAGQAVLSFEEQDQFWVFALPWTVGALGMILLIAGFAAAGLGLASPRSSHGGQAPPEAVPG